MSDEKKQKQDWSGEPWEEVEYPDGGGIWVRAENSAEVWLRHPDNRARIVACVNACAGIPTEALGRIQERIEDIKMIIYEDEIFCDINEEAPNDGTTEED